LPEHVLIWDLETVPDAAALSRIHGRSKLMNAAEVKEVLAGQFPKLPVHQIICIGALIASRSEQGWTIETLGAPHIGERTEADLIASFVERISALRPRLVTYNGYTFDLPVLRYRAMLHRISAPGLAARAYFNRYSDDAIDLCDVLASYIPQAKVSLDLLSKSLGLSGKPQNISGADVERLFLTGKIRDIAEYCEVDVINTYRLWLIFELFCGRLSMQSWSASENSLRSFVGQRLDAKPHLQSTLASPLQPL
jgi:predicted PolB exonuclease-like 3'-5' exonuclease